MDQLLQEIPAPSAEIKKETAADAVRYEKKDSEESKEAKDSKESVIAQGSEKANEIQESGHDESGGLLIAEAPKKKEEVKAKTDAAPDKNAIAGFEKKPVAFKRSGFKDFLGSLNTLGLGKHKNAFIENLATMLDAGLPLVDSLRTLHQDTHVRPMKALLKKIVDAVENGSPLWRALADQHCFTPDTIALIRIGEDAGNLAENMQYLAIQQEKDAGLKSKVKMAMIYPTIVMVIMFIIVIGLGMFVLPNLITVLFTLNVPLPLVTRGVVAFTNFFSTYGYIAVPGSVGGVMLIVILVKFTPLRGPAQWVMFHIPGIGSLAREATIARFGVILGGLLQAGVPLVESLKSLAEVTSIVSYKKFYLQLVEHVSIGDSFGKSFTTIKGTGKLLPLAVQQLITTGERSGALAKILLKVADIYEKKANGTAEKLPVILEPMLLMFIGGLVGTIAFSIIVPIYSIVGNVGQ